MSQNIELKASLRSAAEACEIASRFADAKPRQFIQTDTYFTVEIGRLKLRQCADVGDELIYYLRPDLAKQKRCLYWRSPVESAELVRQNLARACGVDAVVRKSRSLFLHENVRIHIDRVDGLGDFLEFEAVLAAGASPAQSHQLLAFLTDSFKIHPNDLIRQSYRELVREQNRTP